MSLKRLLALCAALLLALGAFDVRAESYVRASTRINFYYQHDGGGRNEKSVWDSLLENRLLALYGHGEIYHDATTDRYLTGRGCCLFSFSHAYQYLRGYAATKSRMADILFEFLSVKPLWKKTDSTMSPPSAHALYAAYFAKLPGINKYAVSNLDSFSKLKAFFEGNKGVVIVNAPSHYVIAVGAVKHGGRQYVQIVDSLISATVRDTRVSVAYSMDFSTVYTPQNAVNYEESVHEYWIPYTELSKCKLRYAFTAGSAPEVPKFMPEKSVFILLPGQSKLIAFDELIEEVAFESLTPGVCTVDETGLVSFAGEGEGTVRAVSRDNPLHMCEVKVYCVSPEENALSVNTQGEELRNPYEGLSLPAGSRFVWADPAPQECGIHTLALSLLDPDGDEAARLSVTAVVVRPEDVLSVPDGVILIEQGAFEETAFVWAALPASVRTVQSGAFPESVKAAFVGNPFCGIGQGAFPEDCVLFYDYGAYLNWLKAE